LKLHFESFIYAHKKLFIKTNKYPSAKKPATYAGTFGFLPTDKTQTKNQKSFNFPQRSGDRIKNIVFLTNLLK